jgi:hypothetical protein
MHLADWPQPLYVPFSRMAPEVAQPDLSTHSVTGRAHSSVFPTTKNSSAPCAQVRRRCLFHIVRFTYRDCPPCTEIWNVENGHLTHKGKAAIVEDAFDSMASKASSRLQSRVNSPSASNSNSPAPSATNSGAEEGKVVDGLAMPVVKKKKKTRKQLKEQEVRCRPLHMGRRLPGLGMIASCSPGVRCLRSFCWVAQRWIRNPWATQQTFRPEDSGEEDCDSPSPGHCLDYMVV